MISKEYFLLIFLTITVYCLIAKTLTFTTIWKSPGRVDTRIVQLDFKLLYKAKAYQI